MRSWKNSGSSLPTAHGHLIDERDAFIAHQLILLKVQRPEGRILAVVGAGHRQGISNFLDKPEYPSAV